MEEIHKSPPVTASATSSTPTLHEEEEEASFSISDVKKGYLKFLISLQEGFGYVKAFVVGQSKKVTARNEKEATRADMETAKMQVKATDDAENTKKHLDIHS